MNQDILAEYGSISGEVNFAGTWPDIGNDLDTAYPPQGPPAGFAYITMTFGVYSYTFSNLSLKLLP